MSTVAYSATADFCSVPVLESGQTIVSELTAEEQLLLRAKTTDGITFNSLKQALKLNDPLNPFFVGTYDGFPSVLRSAYSLTLNGTMSTDELATLVMRWELWVDMQQVAHAIPRLIPLLDGEGHLTEFARNLLLPSDSSGTKFQGLTEAQTLLVEARLKKAPAIERAVVAYPTQRPLIDTDFFPKSFALMRSSYLLGMAHVMGRDDVENLGFPNAKFVLFAAPFTLMQAYLDARYGEGQALKLAPRFGVCSPEEMLRLVSRGKRALGLGFPRIEIPDQADEIDTNLTGFTWHDYLHADLGSRVPAGYREFMIRFLVKFEKPIREAKQGGAPVVIAPGFRIDPLKLTDPKHNLHSFWIDALDINPASTSEFFGMDVHPSFAERVLNDYGPVRGGYSGLVIQDLVSDPQWYLDRGINPESAIHQMGADAITLSEKLRKP